jgi:hypothetical protein
MRHEERVHGRQVVVTTSPDGNGRWQATAEVDGSPVPPMAGSSDAGPWDSEPDAHQAALSAAAAAIDRARQFRGKP